MRRTSMITSPRLIGLSLKTQMSRGSISPFASLPSLATLEAQSVWGMKPYSVGGVLLVLWGLSTLMKPLALSISYLTRSKGVISMKAFKKSGGFGPTSRPCQGWGLNAEYGLTPFLASSFLATFAFFAIGFVFLGATLVTFLIERVFFPLTANFAIIRSWWRWNPAYPSWYFYYILYLFK